MGHMYKSNSQRKTSDHKKAIATAAPLSILLLVLCLLVGATGDSVYSSYSTWLALGRLSGLLVFGFYSEARHYISVANLTIQSVLLLIDLVYTLLSLRITDYIVFAVLFLVA